MVDSGAFASGRLKLLPLIRRWGHCHIMLGSRTLPDVPVTRLVARRQLIGLTDQELRFTPHEVHDLLASSQIVVSEGQAEAIAAQSEGWITGAFPGFIVSRGDYFRASVACMYNSPKCYMRFRLEYQIGSGQVRSLGSWLEASDGMVSRVDVDLSSLSGKEVTFFLRVSAGVDYLGDNGLWIRPRIVR